MSAPSEAHIYVFRNSVAIHFPVARYDDRLPVGVVKVNLVEIGRALVGILYPVELPCSFERKEILAFRLVHVQDILAHNLTVFLINPVICRIGEEVGV